MKISTLGKSIVSGLIVTMLIVFVFKITNQNINQDSIVTTSTFELDSKQSVVTHYKSILTQVGESCSYDYIHVADSLGTIVAIGGTGGGFTGPAYLYEDLARNVADYRLSLLRIHITPPHGRGAKQLLIGLNILRQYNNLKPIMLMGWSMGGASVIIAAEELIKSNDDLKVTSIMTFASQTAGAMPISKIDTKIHIIHGDNDNILDVSCAYTLKRWARNVGEFIILKNAGHGLDERFLELKESVYKILVKDFNLAPAVSQ